MTIPNCVRQTLCVKAAFKAAYQLHHDMHKWSSLGANVLEFRMC